MARVPDSKDQVDERLPYQGSIAEHIRLLRISQEILKRLIINPLLQDAASPTLIHADFHKRNIYVSDDDPKVITGLIDWQSTSVEPAFVYADETPDFAKHPESVSLDDDGQVTPGEKSKTEDKKYKDALISSKTFDVSMKGYVPKLRIARALDDTLLRPFRHCHTSWRDSAAAIRQNLIDISNKWKELELAGSCPYLPTEEELAEHKKQYEDFETTQKLKSWLMRVLDTNSDGWVPADAWEWSKTAHRDAFRTWMETAKNSEGTGHDEMSEQKARRLWPFDER